MSNYFITGSNRGIGLELTKLALTSGHKVWAACRNPHAERSLWELASDYPKSMVLVQFDVAQQGSNDLEKTLPLDQGIDVLINNAGILTGHKESLVDLDLESVKAQFDVNCLGAIRVIKALLPALKKASLAKIINISSLMGSIGDNKSGFAYGYRISKAALNMLTVNLKSEFPDMVSVALHPGWVKTDMGGSNAPLEVADSASLLFEVIKKVSLKDSGKFLNYDGKELPF